MTWKYRGFLVVAGCFLVHLSIGALYSDGNFGPYLVSYMRSNNETITSSYVVWIQAVQSASQGILMFPAGKMEAKFGSQIVVIIGCLIMSLSTMVSYWSCTTSVAGLTMTFGITYGIGTGIAYVTALLGGMKWFPEHRGVVNGIVVAGFGLGASIVIPIQSAFINPDNYSPDENGYFTHADLLSRVPKCFLVMFGLYAGMQLIGCILIAPAPKSLVTVHDSNENSQKDVNEDIKEDIKKEIKEIRVAVQNVDVAPQGFSPRQILHIKEFYFLWWTLFLNGMIVTFYSSMYKVYGQTFIEDDHFFAIVGTCTSIVSACSRLFWGFVVDKITYRSTMIIICALIATWLFTMPMTSHGGKPMYAIWTFAMYFSMAGTFATCPTASSRTFGPKYMTMNYSLVLTNNLIYPLVVAAITDPLINSFGYDGMFLFLGGIICVTMTLTFFFNEHLFDKTVEEYKAKQKNGNVDIIPTLSLDSELKTETKWERNDSLKRNDSLRRNDSLNSNDYNTFHQTNMS